MSTLSTQTLLEWNFRDALRLGVALGVAREFLSETVFETGFALSFAFGELACQKMFT